MPRRHPWVISAVLLFGCAASQYGATDANLAKARAASPRGAALFEQRCATCHGGRGERATSTPRILGEGALPEYPRERNPNTGLAAGDPEAMRLEAQSRPAGAPWRDPFRNAADLYRYVSKNMPPEEAARRALSPEDYWSIVNFMLLSHGVALPSEGVTDKNADAVKL